MIEVMNYDVTNISSHISAVWKKKERIVFIYMTEHYDL